MAHPASYSMGVGGFPPGVQRPGREADHSPPSSAEVKNGRAVLPIHSIHSFVNPVIKIH
jgi:hypothetical protein